ncbi:His-Xaa-Ser system radical SAM maturase HxsB [Thioalkalivibrio sp. ALE30]|uniref:His-Xaa-Ser system radical SAM maturase HxsB n=1 Tax=Thioalkalivibrio sp. ALE30 TaxID=1158181 RepID=UPI0003A0B3ED|nr:His-Xaa-Ser system radical SAM maturase HxsB [Thioalkalivibrio sp. ALE30]
MGNSALGKRFQPVDFFRPPDTTRHYTILPFNFTRLGDKYLITNEAGEYALLDREQLVDFAHEQLSYRSDQYQELRAKHFLLDSNSDSALDLLSLKIRTKHSAVRNFTALHIFVVTLRCDYSCPYCQVSRKTQDVEAFDMSRETALRSLDLVFRSPSKSIKIEFQGGEPLLNFEMVKFVIETAEERNTREGRNLQFVIATNLSFVDEDVLTYCDEHDVYISTSLDGPAELHNKNRPRSGPNGHELVREKIELIRDRLGPDRIAALMTTSERSLSYPCEIIDEYIDAGFNEIFLRPISPYGFAVRTKQAERYDFERFHHFYQSAMDYILFLNRSGLEFSENYSRILLQKLLTPDPNGYVDLQSPAGLGISVLLYNYDGGVYASDEARMLAEMGDETFRLGDVHSNSYEQLMLNPTLLDVLEATVSESIPECYECAFRPYCGTDPVYHHTTQGDWVGHKASSSFCARTKSIVGYLIQKLEAGGDDASILKSWVS